MRSFRLIRGLLWTLAVFVSMALPQDSVSQKTEKTDLYSLARSIHENINAARQARGLNKLRWNEKLAGEAGLHATNMAHRRFFPIPIRVEAIWQNGLMESVLPGIAVPKTYIKKKEYQIQLQMLLPHG